MSPRQLRQQIGQLLMAGFDGPTLPVEIRSIAREFSLGGIVFFARNVDDPGQVAEVARRASELTSEGLPPWVAVDQEGGRVARFKKGFTLWPPVATLGRCGDVSLARRFGAALAAELRAVGITLDFAPVLDVFTNPKNTVIGDRALAADPHTAATLGVAIIEAFEAAGLASCGKHFPGHGDTHVDSHHELPVVEHDLARLREVEFQPFRAAIRANVPAIMTAHVLVAAIDELHPGTLSRAVVQDLLRHELGFDGLVFTDDMEMKAVAGRMPVPRAAVEALAAGCDVVLVCSGNHDLQVATLEAIIRAVEQEELPFSRVEQALARQRRMKQRYLLPPAGPRGQARQVVGSEEHQVVAAEMARYV